MSFEVVHAACAERGPLCINRGTGVTNAAALPPPRLHLVDFGVGHEDGRLPPRPMQLALYIMQYLCYQQTNWIGPNCFAVWPHHVRLVANHEVYSFHTGVSEYETAEPTDDRMLSPERATTTRGTHGRKSGLRHDLRTPVQETSKPHPYPVQNSDGWALGTSKRSSDNLQRVTRQPPKPIQNAFGWEFWEP